MSPGWPGEHALDWLARRADLRKVAPCGSAGVKGIRIAAGEAGIYSQPGRAGKRWDSCAPEAIVVAAGGAATDERGNAFEYASGELSNDHGFIATNGKLHGAVIDLIRQASP